MIEYKLVGWPGGPDDLVQPDIRPIARRKYALREAYHVQLKAGNSPPVYLVVPAGFELDGASIPRLAWSLAGLTPDGLIRAAALVHDYLYRNRGHAVPISMVWVPRKSADAIFLHLMKLAGMAPWRAQIAYRAVRWFGPRW